MTQPTSALQELGRNFWKTFFADTASLRFFLGMLALCQGGMIFMLNELPGHTSHTVLHYFIRSDVFWGALFSVHALARLARVLLPGRRTQLLWPLDNPLGCALYAAMLATMFDMAVHVPEESVTAPSSAAVALACFVADVWLLTLSQIRNSCSYHRESNKP
jgi:hypothetical protein